uniref:Uncharacterized protein n=1 Tax=viral metagenome TaxID=1070528 RepID=A0A6C0IP87_9ZZZZ
METQKQLQETQTNKTEMDTSKLNQPVPESAYKCCILDQEGNIKQIMVFSGQGNSIDFKDNYFSEEERSLYETLQPDIISSSQLIHLDDSICTIKKKILNEFTHIEVSYDELYLFGCSNKFIDLKTCFENITNDDKALVTKPVIGQLLNNLQITSRAIYEELNQQDDDTIYTYNQLMNILAPYKNKFNFYYPLGQDFSVNTDYLFSANPFSILPSGEPLFKLKSNNLLYSFENYLLLDYLSLDNNTFYMCMAEQVINYGNQNNIDSKYLTSLYFPLLASKNIYSKEELEENKQQLLQETNELMQPSFFKVQENIKTFHQIDTMELQQLPYVDNGIIDFHIVIHPVVKTFIPIDIIFKQLSSTQEMPFIKYNPGSKKESIVRLFCNKRTKKGQKIPVLTKQNIQSLFKHSGRVKQLSIYVKKVINTHLIECFIDFDYNGNIIIRSISNKHISYDNIQPFISSIVNPLIDQINLFIQSSGYKIHNFHSLNQEHVEIIHLNYQSSLQLNPGFDLHTYDRLLYGIFDIVNYDVKKGADLFFKRVKNYRKMDAIASMFAYYTKLYRDPNIIISLVASNFDSTFEEMKEEYIKFQNNHQFINGKYVNKSAQLIDNPGFPTTLLYQPFENKLNINVKNIDSIQYIPILQTYLNTFLRFVQYDNGLPFNVKDYMKQIKSIKTKAVEDFEPHVDNFVVGATDIAVPVHYDNQENMFKTEDDEDSDSDDDAIYMDSDSEQENSDSEQENSDSEQETSKDKTQQTVVQHIEDIIKTTHSAEDKQEEPAEIKEQEEPAEIKEQEEPAEIKEQEEPAEIKEQEEPAEIKEQEEPAEIKEQEENLNKLQDTIGVGVSKTAAFFRSLTKNVEEPKENMQNEEPKENMQKGGSVRMFIKKMKELQPVLFKKSSDNEDSYARNCQANSRRQPIILTNDEKIKIDEEYPNSYDVALPYSTDENKQFWYICPRYWCLQNNAPMSEEQVKNGECGGKIVPQNAKEPPAGHYIVEFTDKKEHIDKDGNYRQHYPGLLKNKTSSGNCLPCCFKKLNTEQQQKMRRECNIEIDDYNGDPNIIKKIVGTKDKSIDMDDKRIAKNILLPERFPMPQHRWGFLPVSAELFLQVDQELDIDKNNKAMIRQDRRPLLRYGLEFSRNQSFMAFLNDLYSTYENNAVPMSNFRDILAKSIDLDLFIQSNNSNLVSSFLPKKYVFDPASVDKIKNTKFYQSLDLSKESQMHFLKDTVASYDNFLAYLRDADSFIDHTYLWDIVTSGKIALFPEAFNLILLEITNQDITNDIALICPTNLNKSKLFDKNRKSVFLLKNKEYYEPIYKYGNTTTNKTAGTATVVKFMSPSDVSTEVKKVLKTIEYTSNKYCKPVQVNTRVIEYKTNLPAEEILKTLQSHSYTISHQIMNYNAKIIAFSVKIRNTDSTAFYLPTYPSGKIDNIDVKYIDDIEWQPYEATKQFLKDFYEKTEQKVPCKPLVKVVEDGIIVGILTLSNQFISVNDYLPETEDDLENITTSNYKDDYVKADTALTLNKNKDTQRINIVRNIYLETQFYNSFRNKVRILINDYFHHETKKEMEGIIANNSYLYAVKLKKIIKLLQYISKEHVLFQDFDDSVFDSIDEKIAFINVDKDNQFCLEDENKLCLPKKHLISELNNEKYYYQKLADELLRYKRVRLFMLNPTQYLTIRHFDYKISSFEILLLQSTLFDKYLSELEPFETSSYVHNVGFDMSNPEKHPTYSNKIDLTSQQQLDNTTHNINFIEKSCVIETKNIREAPFQKWEKFVSEESEYLSFENTPLCSFFIVLYMIQEKTKIKMDIADVKNKLIEQYNALKSTHYTKILNILSKQGNERLAVKLQKSEIDFESMILDEEYTLSLFDLFLLCNVFELPVILFSDNKFKNMGGNIDWMVLSGNIETDNFYFVYSSSSVGKTESYLIQPAIPYNQIKSLATYSKKTDYKEHFVDIDSILV